MSDKTDSTPRRLPDWKLLEALERMESGAFHDWHAFFLALGPERCTVAFAAMDRVKERFSSSLKTDEGKTESNPEEYFRDTTFWDSDRFEAPEELSEDMHRRIEGHVEENVHRAISDLLEDPSNPDFLLVDVYPASLQSTKAPGWGVELLVEGRGLETIARAFDFDELLDQELKHHERGGKLDPNPESLEKLQLLLDKMSASARRLRRLLELPPELNFGLAEDLEVDSSDDVDSDYEDEGCP